MKMNFVKPLTLGLALLLPASFSLASVSIDEAGVGVVGKGDVQLVFDWNNDQLQANAANLRFRYGSAQTASWICEGTNRSGKVVVTQREATVELSAAVAFDARKNRQGMVTGFNLLGFDSSQTSYAAAGSCPNNPGFIEPFHLVGEISWSGTEAPTLQVSADGVLWLDLPISY